MKRRVSVLVGRLVTMSPNKLVDRASRWDQQRQFRSVVPQADVAGLYVYVSLKINTKLEDTVS